MTASPLAVRQFDIIMVRRQKTSGNNLKNTQAGDEM